MNNDTPNLTARLRAFGRDCVTHGDMTPMAERMLHTILDEHAVSDTSEPEHAPDGQHCARCNGVHNPQPGTAFVTSRTWGPAEDDERD